MCEISAETLVEKQIIEYSGDKFRITQGDYTSDYYSELKDLRLNDLFVMRDNREYAQIPYDIYLMNSKKETLIARKQVWFKVAKDASILGEYWLQLYTGNIILNWAVYDYDMGFLFINSLIKCNMFDIVPSINSIDWKDFDYDNSVIQWTIDNANTYIRKNVTIACCPDIDQHITKIIWDYIICKFDEIDF
jgi:hypothetical protein